ncbi:hypothetical protein IV203_007312 [Nitzschia inconspicua]|uniref:Uncharacterized protein n=1 Tax=Nitzschia inconspicua TaxID=303405 RepID=A0A9K3PCU3_9STRA|nr:hypothetical protein IV203_007312 [Nitzschia inconspicua]
MTDPSLPPPSMSYTGPMKQVETALLSSLTDLFVRNEVDACMQSMLLSVESAHHLEQQLELKNAKQQLEITQAEHRATVLEAHAERLERYNRRVGLADDLVVELVKLNREMQQLLEWKEEHEYKVRNYDAVLAKLAQTEEELNAANRVSYGGEPKPRRETPTQKSPLPSKATDVTSRSNGDLKVSSSTTPTMAQTSVAGDAAPEKTPETTVELLSDESREEVDQKVESGPAVAFEQEGKQQEEMAPSEQIETEGESAGETLKAAIAAEAGHSMSEEEPPASQMDESDEKKPPAVELIADEPIASQQPEQNSEVTANLLTLEVEPLMEIFGFLDPMDILNTAQINMKMYTKVDNIFGISEDGQSPPIPTPAAAPTNTPAKQTAAQTKDPPPSTASTPSSTKSTPMVPQTTKAAPSQGSFNSATGGPLGKGLLSMLQPAKPSTPSGPVGSSSRSGGGSSSTSGVSQPLNAKVAQSMASKLSDAELAAIISMTDKLSKLEKEVHLLRNEKELMVAKLEGTENVKQYLINKVKEVEMKLQRSKEDEVKVTQQIASDQEVIAFLDSRVQELEQQTVDLTKENSVIQAELDTLKVSTSKKITMLSDMLKYEREKLREDESEWKATKKLLVKEVKSCRAQIFTLQAERDGLKGQNEMLNRAINLKNNGNSNRSPGRGRRKNT